MTKVYCKKYQEELPALDRPPYPGPRGEEIFNNVSKKSLDGVVTAPNNAHK